MTAAKAKKFALIALVAIVATEAYNLSGAGDKVRRAIRR